MANNTDALGTRASDTMLPVVPLFHANSWGIAFSAPTMGTKLVMPGAKARRRVGLRTALH
jgi:fatty-acyl-CoA synthase